MSSFKVITMNTSFPLHTLFSSLQLHVHTFNNVDVNASFSFSAADNLTVAGNHLETGQQTKHTGTFFRLSGLLLIHSLAITGGFHHQLLLLCLLNSGFVNHRGAALLVAEKLSLFAWSGKPLEAESELTATKPSRVTSSFVDCQTVSLLGTCIKIRSFVSLNTWSHFPSWKWVMHFILKRGAQHPLDYLRPWSTTCKTCFLLFNMHAREKN